MGVAGNHMKILISECMEVTANHYMRVLILIVIHRDKFTFFLCIYLF
jgi:hypothetical protein